jgi:high-affinity iron transporter
VSLTKTAFLVVACAGLAIAPEPAAPRTTVDPDAAGQLIADLYALRESYGEAREELSVPQVRAAMNEQVDALRRLLIRSAELDALLAEPLETLARTAQDVPEPIAIEEQVDAALDRVFAAMDVPLAPRAPTHPKRAAALYSTHCAVCHGRSGEADTVVAHTMVPPPERFADSVPLNRLSPLRAFYAVTYGVHETAMPAFPTLDETDRWALAFYVFALKPAHCEADVPRTTVEALTRATNAQLTSLYGEPAVACLRNPLFARRTP